MTHLLCVFQIRMAGAIIENMSGRKLAMLGAVLVMCQILSILVGAVFAPSPNNAVSFWVANAMQSSPSRFRSQEIELSWLDSYRLNANNFCHWIS